MQDLTEPFAFRVCDRHDPDIDEVGRALGEYNDATVGPSSRQPLAVLAHDAHGDLAAGLSGYTAWGWLYIQWLWVGPAFRSRGLAATLLEHAEEEARKRGCIGAHIDTFNPDALRLYEIRGYKIFGEIPEFVAGQTRSFLQKRWSYSPCT